MNDRFEALRVGFLERCRGQLSTLEALAERTWTYFSQLESHWDRRAGTGKSELTVTSKDGKQIISGTGRDSGGPYNFQLTKQ